MTPSTASAASIGPISYALPPDALEGLLRLAAHVAITETATLFLVRGEDVWPLATSGLESDAARAAALLLPDVLDLVDHERTFLNAALEAEPVSLLASVLCGESGMLIIERFSINEPGTEAVLVLAHPVPRAKVSPQTRVLLSEVVRQVALRVEARQDKKQLADLREVQATLQHHLSLLIDRRCTGYCSVDADGTILSASEGLLSRLELSRQQVDGSSFEDLFAIDGALQDQQDTEVVAAIPWSRLHGAECVHRLTSGTLLRFLAFAAPVVSPEGVQTWHIALLGCDDGAVLGSVEGREQQTILIAEDHPVNQRVIQGMVEKLGLRAEIVSNGLEAVHAVCHNRYAVVLMDCQMPEMDGIEATRFIRGNEDSIGRIPIIAVTAFGQDDDRRRCIEAGVDEFMVKPIRMDALASVLQRWTQPDQTPAPPVAPPANTPAERIRESLDRLRSDLDASIVVDIVSLFIDDSTARIRELDQLATAQRWQDARDLVHKIKGSCGSLGARELTEACEAFELEKSSNPEILRSRLRQIEKCFQSTIPHLQDYVKSISET
jgi:CheY-like chemotaxis protein/HPt (histidine-containing phosphotransfer) domain-containing protein